MARVALALGRRRAGAAYVLPEPRYRVSGRAGGQGPESRWRYHNSMTTCSVPGKEAETSFHPKENAMRKTGKKKSFVDYELPSKALEGVRGGHSKITTLAVGEEGNGGGTIITTLAVGEETGCPIATTQAVGEEGGHI